MTDTILSASEQRPRSVPDGVSPISEAELQAVFKITGMIEEKLRFIRRIDPHSLGDRTSGARAVLLSLRREIRKEFCQ